MSERKRKNRLPRAEALRMVDEYRWTPDDRAATWLEKRGLIEKTRNGEAVQRRQNGYKLTQAGKALTERASPAKRKTRASALVGRLKAKARVARFAAGSAAN